MTEVDKPEVGHNDILIKIKKTAICGTDVHIYNWDEWSQKTIPVPMVVGHEYVGEVVAIGQEVRGFEIGDRVSGEVTSRVVTVVTVVAVVLTYAVTLSVWV